jgi:hypothetical protein
MLDSDLLSESRFTLGYDVPNHRLSSTSTHDPSDEASIRERSQSIAETILATPLDAIATIIDSIFDLYVLFRESKSLTFSDLPIPIASFLVEVFAATFPTGDSDSLNVLLSFFLGVVHSDRCSSLFLVVPEVADGCCAVVIDARPITARVRCLCLRMLKFLCCEQNGIPNMSLYVLTAQPELLGSLIELQAADDVAVRAEALCVIYALLKNHPNPDLVQPFSVLLTDLAARTRDECFDYVVLVATAFLECCRTPPPDLAPLFDIFPSVSIACQISIMHLLLIVIEAGDVSIGFPWAIAGIVRTQHDEQETFVFLRLAAAAFAVSPELIQSAFAAGVIGWLFQLTQDEPWRLRRYAMIALIHAFQFSPPELAVEIIRMGMLQQIALFVESDSSVLAAKIPDAVGHLARVLEAIGQTKVADEVRELGFDGAGCWGELECILESVDSMIPREERVAIEA